jgi:hypothetical protein
MNGKCVISLGDVKQGDNVLNYGIITGHIVGTVKDTNHLNVSHTVSSPYKNESSVPVLIAVSSSTRTLGTVSQVLRLPLKRGWRGTAKVESR